MKEEDGIQQKPTGAFLDWLIATFLLDNIGKRYYANGDGHTLGLQRQRMSPFVLA